MALYSRHPRFTIALLVLIFIFVLLFANSGSPDMLERPYPVALSKTTSLPPGFFVQEQLKLNEAHYQDMLEQRQGLIAKWGPTAEKVDPFPSNGEFYTLWDFFLPSFRCPHKVERVGIMGDGGKWTCGLERVIPKKNCVMYSFGINGESSYEAEIMERAKGCQLYGYDFSVYSFGPEIEHVPSIKARSHFYSYALGPKDAYATEDFPKTYSLRTLMEKNGHDFIDILKVDIEGGEFESLDTFIDSFDGEPLPFGQLQLEVHAFRSETVTDFAKFLKWWEKLERAGLRPFFSEPNLVYVNLVRGVRPDLIEYSFINIRGNHELVSDGFLHHQK
ncbi:hypothetical protein SERLADRAFT_388764 [Serpula lacrymans var. lacrymans S7.9]|uniref:Methyltransferase domain-containing protein n=1 Tax=Serpula lacrymans var. lacrymans (strain S7.9) TaxID=578457 RepID=F8NV33_SERL9|nr:uncharacterized protein SERLADRAFT_388764 [Serpula lacrymans var. lacrymans S7.9]EGO25988.1 hypothetical protein SERLADRAFT_388764 [Serpula lacrymans var. lacrymans S7.9]